MGEVLYLSESRIKNDIQSSYLCVSWHGDGNRNVTFTKTKTATHPSEKSVKYNFFENSLCGRTAGKAIRVIKRAGG
jgi:hypothetical protein